MEIFSLLFTNLIPLYFIILLGWMAGKFFGVDKKSLGGLGIYILMPVVAMGFVTKIDLQPVYLFLPIFMFCFYSAATALVLHTGKRIYPDSRANLLSLLSIAGNNAYFGIPLVLLLFPEKWVGVYILGLFGTMAYQATIMYYIVNRSNFDVKTSLKNLAKFPTLYALIIGLCINLAGLNIPTMVETYLDYFKGALVVVGMMIVGASLANTKPVFAPKFITLTFLGKFIICPAISYIFILLDKATFHIFPPQVHQIIFLFSIVPPAANIAAFAAQFNMHPEKAATTILIGTCLALITIPLTLAISGLF